jgi:hypothetical protein
MDEAIDEFNISLSYLHEISDVPTVRKQITVHRANGTFGFISTSCLQQRNQHSIPVTVQAEIVRTHDNTVNDPMNVDHDVQDVDSDCNAHEFPPNDDNLSEESINVAKFPWYKHTTDEINNKYSQIFCDYVMDKFQSECYGIWDQFSNHFDFITRKLLITQQLVVHHTFQNFNVGMLLFGICIWLLVANVTYNQASGFLSLFLPVIGTHIINEWPLNDDDLERKFWSLINLPQSERQLISTEIVRTYVRNGVQFSTHETRSVHFTMYNIDDIIRLQLNDPFYLRDLRAGLKRAEKCSKHIGVENVYEEYDDGNVIQQLRKNGPLKWWHIYSFQAFFDGLRLHKDGKTGLTAVYLVNTLIPLKDRFRSGNVIVLALLSSKCELKYSKFVQIVIDKLRTTLQVEGINVVLNGREIKLGGIITSLIADIKERDSLLWMNGGYFRCLYCYLKGCVIHGHKKVTFPKGTTKIQQRTNLSFRLDAQFGTFTLLLMFNIAKVRKIDQ